MKTADAIIKWYDGFEPEKHGIDALLKARQRLAVYCTGIGEQIRRIESLHKEAYHERKVKEAQEYLRQEGTQSERTAASTNEDLRLAEARYEGELKGLKIMLDTYFKVLDSMSSWINVLNKL